MNYFFQQSEILKFEIAEFKHSAISAVGKNAVGVLDISSAFSLPEIVTWVGMYEGKVKSSRSSLQPM